MPALSQEVRRVLISIVQSIVTGLVDTTEESTVEIHRLKDEKHVAMYRSGRLPALVRLWQSPEGVVVALRPLVVNQATIARAKRTEWSAGDRGSFVRVFTEPSPVVVHEGDRSWRSR